MLGILQVNEQNLKNQIKSRVISIENVQFFEIIVEITSDYNSYFAKRMINKAMKIFAKQNVRKICAKEQFAPFLAKHKLQFVSHYEIFYAKRFEILKMLNKKTIFVHSKNRDISDMVDFLAKNFDNIFLNIKVRENQIKQEFLEKYGVSVIDFNAKYKFEEGVYCCFDKPENFFYGDIILNLSKEQFPVKSICDICCKTDYYKGNTDIAALSSALINYNLKFGKNIYIKNFIIKA